MLNLNQTFFKPISHATHPTLHNHPQLPIMIDILSRKEQHHLLLLTTDPEKIHRAVINSITSWLRDDLHIKTLLDAECIYIASQQITGEPEEFKNMTRDFAIFREKIRTASNRMILAISYTPTLIDFLKLIQPLLHDPQWRIIIFADPQYPLPTLTPFFSTLKLTKPTDSQYIALLNAYKKDLEQFHHVQIAEETVKSAFSLATHYLPQQCSFSKAFELLDSAAARAHEIVSITTLTHVLSSWTHIPLTCLQNTIFQAKKMMESLQRQVIGQDTALTAISSTLQRALIKLREKPTPLCLFLLVGAEGVGKTTTTRALGEHLFGHKNALFTVNMSEHYDTMNHVKIMNEHRHVTLLTAIENTPYAVILLRNIQQAPPATLALFKNIITQGYAQDETGKTYDFRHTIFVMTTTVGADHISTLTQAPPLHEIDKNIDLLQLVMAEHPDDPEPMMHHHLSIEELRTEMLPILENYFSADLLQHLNIIPFLPLDPMTLEKIMRQKINLLAKKVDLDFGIELTFTPEVAAFLAHEFLLRKSHKTSLDTLLDEKLYACVAHALLTHVEEKHKTSRLLLQLSDDGQMLRCDRKSIGNAVLT